MPQHPHKSLPYRPALDGLRGIAVAAVVIYHVWPNALPGGWLGVDLFFVLSGFLITSLLTTEWARWGSISLLGFWTARARRLLPSLVAMLLAVTVASHFWTLPSRRSAVSWDVVAALFYGANWRMYVSNEAYFATDVGLPSPVRHTWSLAIEEQYYLLYPLLLLALLFAVRRARPQWRRHLLGVALLTLALLSAWRMQALYVPGIDPSRVYYGTDTRVFELLIGSAAGVWVGGREFGGLRRRKFDTVAGYLAWPALVALAVAFAVLHDDVSALFPYGLVVLNLIAVLPIIAGAARRRSAVATLLAREPLRRLGLISYSLYLWHWPVVVFLGPTRLPLRGLELGATQIVVSIALASASYRFVEQPIRAGGLRSLMPTAPSSARLIGIIAVPALVVANVVVAQRADGSEGAQSVGATAASSFRFAPQPYVPLRTVHRISLIGNSIPASVDAAFPASRYPDIDLRPDSSFGCDPFGGAVVVAGKREEPLANCAQFRTQWSKQLRTDRPDLAAFFIPQTMVLDHTIDGRTVAFGTAAYTTFIRSTLDGVRQGVTSSRIARFVVVTLACHDQPLAQISQKVAMVNDITRVKRTNAIVSAWAKDRGVPIVDQFGFLCRAGFHSEINGIPLYTDGLHFSPASGAIFWSWLAPQFQQILRRE
ncbi:acyltransferase [Allobranchiibius sp. GilTou73]|uniref:acyltransferase family protein n=1 Tax=Allobranchiibius sp. GilTou73 TaxID=2904523 RepID=UPI001F340432|nr:acyltransferase [Allobranchiibius sp. GilTou73]UIJ33818.1 acyltransferase [Allobranchiibius sp. GilTou73]